MLKNEFFLLKKLLKIKSVSGHENKCSLFLFNWIKRNLPYDTLELQKVGKTRHNIILKRGSPNVTLTSHIDTVSGNVTVRETKDRIYGRGACDAKGQIVTQLFALKQAIKNGLRNYACFYVVGEEVDSIGARHIVKKSDIGSEYLISGEPTKNLFVKKSRGVLDLKISAKGKKQHTSLANCKSAIHDLIVDLHKLLNANLGYPVNIGIIKGGSATNVSADMAEADLCVRIDDSASAALKKIKNVLKVTNIRVSSPAIEPFVFYTPKEYKDNATEVLFSADCGIYAKQFKKIMMFGPGSIEMAHSKNEYILKSDMKKAINIIQTLLIKYR